MRKYDQFLRGNQVITGVEDCNYTDLKNCDVKMWCNFIEDKIMNFKNPQDEKNKMYVNQMIDWCKKNESVEFFAMILVLLKVNKHIYGHA